MAKKTTRQKPTTEKREGGIYIGDGATVNAGGDLVGRDKISVGLGGEELENLFERLENAIQNHTALKTNEKEELSAKSKELEDELKKSNPDLGTLTRLKQFIAAKGGTISVAVGAIFQYGPVQETIKMLAQRLVGG